MKQWLILVVLALAIWWFFFRQSKPQAPAGLYSKYIEEHNRISDFQDEACDKFINEHVSFEGGPEAFRNLHKIIRDKYASTFRENARPKGSFSKSGLMEYINRINGVPSMYVNEMTECYKKYGIPESVRNKHMALVNSQHDQIVQYESKWYKIMEPFIRK